MWTGIGRALRRLRGRDAEERAARARRRVQKARVAPWVEARGDETLRLDYDLGPDDLVLDLGGYKGQWASDIHGRFRCRVYVFEPVPAFATAIERRFAHNDSIRVFPVGLGGADATVAIGLEADATSMFQSGSGSLDVEIKAAAPYLEALGVEEVALMKVNIEGAEYDLLDHLLDAGWLPRIRDLQVQFHDFVDDAEARMQRIQARLATTHEPTWQYPFVWENWSRREA